MRLFSFSIVVLLLVTQTALAQNAAPNLDAVLREFEKTTAGLQTFIAAIERIHDDKALGIKDTYNGFVSFSKAKNQARLQLEKKGNPNIFEKYISDGKDLYEYAPANKVVRVHALPKNQAGALQQAPLLSFVFDMNAKQAQARYAMELNLQDKNYYVVHIVPKFDNDKIDFARARICIRRADNLLAQIWYVQGNRVEVTWNLQPRANPPIPAKHFEPDVPMGWRLQKVQAAALNPAKKMP